ncbi:SAV_915 family protein [Streptomyces asiaticus]|uniref:SAV_915 family protein n=1 Tax=Streptomyces asiaticus TaxID=114695 RepID=UPI0037FF8054
MNDRLYEDDPEPDEPVPAGRGRVRYVPVRPGPAGCAVRLFRTPHGSRTAVGFSTRRRLAAVLGARQPWIRLGESALRALAEPLGATSLTVDPRLAVRDIAPPAPVCRHDTAPAVARPAPPRHHTTTPAVAPPAPPRHRSTTPVGLLSPLLG